jgi:DNA-binding response OmpR family regulator
MDTLDRSDVSLPIQKLVFVVEDDQDIAHLLQHNLQAVGFQVELFATGNSVLEAAFSQPPALILLDVMLPGMDGFDLCHRIRQSKPLSRIPIIFVSAKSKEADRIRGLEAGGDDYIVKPFSLRELVARVHTVLRSRHEIQPPEILRLGELEIDPASMVLRVGGQAVQTTVREFRLLEYLATHQGRVFTRDQLLAAVWKETAFVTPRSVDVYMRRLREKIEVDPHRPRYLKTLRGIGYRMEGPKPEVTSSMPSVEP